MADQSIRILSFSDHAINLGFRYQCEVVKPTPSTLLSAEATATPVPEPGSLALLGDGSRHLHRRPAPSGNQASN